jgi:putative transposase
MSQTVSPSANRSYGLARVCRVWDLPRSTVYDHLGRQETGGSYSGLKRGPVGACSDAELLERIRDDLASSPWHGEGHRKVWARLRFKGTRTSKPRVLRLMRENGLLAPTRTGSPRGPQVHDGSIVPERPDVLWGTDATSTLTGEGNATIFVTVDHCTAECLGIHAARRGTRFEALEPLHQAVRERWGQVSERVATAAGLALRHDHGSQFTSDDYQDQLTFLGIESSPSFVRQPEGNGCAERFIKTLKEQVLWIQRFETVEELRLALLDFKERYNREWLIERHGHRSPREHYATLVDRKEAA